MKRRSIGLLGGAFGVVPVQLAACEEVQALPLRALRVYLVLLSRYNAKRDGWSWGMAALARDTGIARDHIPEAVKRLEAGGLVEVTRGAGQTASHYRLTIPASVELQGEGAKSVPTLDEGGGQIGPHPPGGRGLNRSPQRGPNRSPLSHEAVPREGAKSVPREGTESVPPLHRDYTEGTEDPPYPHNEQNRAEPSDPPSPPASRGEQKGSPLGFELPERMRGAKLPPGSRFARPTAPAPAQVAAPVLAAELPSASRGDLVRQLARDIGVRPREARRMLEREDAIAASPAPPPPLQVDAAALDELRALGWLTPEQEAAASRRTA
jgi:hypothetical protein